MKELLTPRRFALCGFGTALAFLAPACDDCCDEGARCQIQNHMLPRGDRAVEDRRRPHDDDALPQPGAAQLTLEQHQQEASAVNRLRRMK